MKALPCPRGLTRCIDATALERMGRLARGFPGRTISLARARKRSRTVPEKVVLHIDGVPAEEVLEGATAVQHDAA